MRTIAGVRFRGTGKIYYFDPGTLPIKKDTPVIVETARGLEYAIASGPPREVSQMVSPQPLRQIVRIATQEDIARAESNREKEKEAMAICREKIRRHGLEMKLIDAEYAFDNNKILFYFTADGRIDFRELVKDLASIFRTRIELRQIGVRDETKILGGIGICGRPLCCSTWLTDFVPVSIRMAKEQNLSLNPTKISGTCGRLMCCLKNEEDTYEYLNSKLPANGDSVTTLDGMQGVVASVNVLRQKVRVLLEVDGEKQMQEFDAAQLTFRPRRRREKKNAQGGTAQGKGRGPEGEEKTHRQDGLEMSDGLEPQEKQHRPENYDKNQEPGETERSRSHESRGKMPGSENKEKKGNRRRRPRREDAQSAT